MTINTIEDSLVNLEEWYALRDKADELDKPESKFQIHWDKAGSPVVSRGVDIPAQIRRQGLQQALSRHTTLGSHCLVSGYQDDELQRFDELARWAAIYLDHVDLKGEAARDFLIVLLKNYFLEQKNHRKTVGLVGNHEGVIIEFPFKAAKIYFGHLASDSPAQRSNDESPTMASEEQESEITQPAIKTLLKACKGVIDKDTLQEKRREAVELWQQLRESIIGEKATKKSLYIRADQHPSEFFKWQRGEHFHGSSPDVDIRCVLTEYPDWDPPDDPDREDPDDFDPEWDH